MYFAMFFRTVLYWTVLYGTVLYRHVIGTHAYRYAPEITLWLLNIVAGHQVHISRLVAKNEKKHHKKLKILVSEHVNWWFFAYFLPAFTHSMFSKNTAMFLLTNSFSSRKMIWQLRKSGNFGNYQLSTKKFEITTKKRSFTIILAHFWALWKA